jgi:hypothetical protein
MQTDLGFVVQEMGGLRLGLGVTPFKSGCPAVAFTVGAALLRVG